IGVHAATVPSPRDRPQRADSLTGTKAPRTSRRHGQHTLTPCHARPARQPPYRNETAAPAPAHRALDQTPPPHPGHPGERAATRPAAGQHTLPRTAPGPRRDHPQSRPRRASTGKFRGYLTPPRPADSLGVKLITSFEPAPPFAPLTGTGIPESGRITQENLLLLAAGEAIAIVVRGYCGADRCQQAAERLFTDGRYNEYDKLPGVHMWGLNSSASLSSPDRKKKYFTDAMPTVRALRSIWAPYLSPIDRLRLELQE